MRTVRWESNGRIDEEEKEAKKEEDTVDRKKRERRSTAHIPFRGARRGVARRATADGRVNFLRLHFTCTCPNSFVSGTEFIHRQLRCASLGIPCRSI